MKKIIVEFIFGVRAKPVDTIKDGYRTVNYNAYAQDFGEWCKMFNVSMLHDRKPKYLD